MELELPHIDKEKITDIKTKNYYNVVHDEEVKEFIIKNDLEEAFVYENLPVLMNFIESRKMCKDCPGLMKCKTNGVCTSLSLNTVSISSKYQHCSLRRDLEKIKYQFLFLQTNDKYLQLTFKDLAKVFKNERTELLKVLLTMIKNNDFSNGVYLYGDDGIGKSCIMSVFAKEIAKKSDKDFISYIDATAMVPNLVDEFFNDPNAYEEDIELLSHCSYLFIDNFGQEEKTKTGKIEVLYKIINNRVDRDLPTYFISKYSLEQIRAMYGLSIKDRATNSIIDAIKSNCDVIELISMKYPL